MNILLIQPPLNKKMISLGILEPLSLEVLAAPLTDHKVEILDMRIENEILKKLNEFRPDVVGITALSVEVLTAKETLKQIKAFNPSITTIVGGHHATLKSDDFEHDYVDFIMLGHGFKNLSKLLESIENKKDIQQVENIIFKQNNSFIHNKTEALQDLSDLSIPVRKLTDKYRKHYCMSGLSTPVALLITSLGCPFRCDFCACWKMQQGRYFARNNEDIVEELKQIREKIVFFGDDNTFFDVNKSRELCSLIKENGIKKFYAGYARSDTIAKNPELIKEWKQVGLSGLIVGFEAISDSQLGKFNKNSSLEANEKAFEVLDKYKIVNYAHFVITQDFTEKDFGALYDYIDKWRITFPFFTIMTPLPGTEFYCRTKDEIIEKDFDRFDLSHNVLPAKIGNDAFFENYLRLYKKAYSLSRTLRLVIKRKELMIGLIRTLFLLGLLKQLSKEEKRMFSEKRNRKG